MGPDKIVGATAKTVEAAVKAYEDGADYLGVGAIYPTTTKVVTILTKVSTLKDICEAYGKPCEGKCDADILLGGFRMECEEKGIVVDETFDTGIDETERLVLYELRIVYKINCIRNRMIEVIM